MPIKYNFRVIDGHNLPAFEYEESSYDSTALIKTKVFDTALYPEITEVRDYYSGVMHTGVSKSNLAMIFARNNTITSSSWKRSIGEVYLTEGDLEDVFGVAYKDGEYFVIKASGINSSYPIGGFRYEDWQSGDWNIDDIELFKQKIADTLDLQLHNADITEHYYPLKFVLPLSGGVGPNNPYGSGEMNVVIFYNCKLKNVPSSHNYNHTFVFVYEGKNEVDNDVVNGKESTFSVGLNHYWTYNEDNSDKIGTIPSYNYNINYTYGIIESGIYLQRSLGSRINLGNIGQSFFQGINSNKSISIWFKQTDDTSSSLIRFSKDGEMSLMTIKESAGQMYCYFNIKIGSNYTEFFTSPQPINTWTHFVVSLDLEGGVCKLYVNGVENLLGSDALPSGNVNSVPTLQARIGANIQGSPGEFFNGYIDEIGFWDRAITADEVTYLYNNGNGRQFPF